MLISATGNNPVRGGNDAGFTLIEVLVVVFIIGLMSGAVALTLLARPNAVQTEASALANALRQAARESIVSGEVIAFGEFGREMVFERYRAGAWQRINRTTKRLARDDDAKVRLLVMRQGSPRALERKGRGLRGQRSNEELITLRHLVFSPIGEVTPATLTLFDGIDRAIIEVRADGTVVERYKSTPGAPG